MSSIFTSSLFISFVRDDIRHHVLFVSEENFVHASYRNREPWIGTANECVAMQHVENSA